MVGTLLLSISNPKSSMGPGQVRELGEIKQKNQTCYFRQSLFLDTLPILYQSRPAATIPVSRNAERLQNNQSNRNHGEIEWLCAKLVEFHLNNSDCKTRTPLRGA